MSNQIKKSLELQINDLNKQIFELQYLRNTLFIKYCSIIDNENKKE